MYNYKLRAFTHALLLVTTPPSLVHPQEFSVQSFPQEVAPKNLSSLSYDEILELLQSIESGEFEERASLEEQERVMQFITHLAKEGAIPGVHDIFALESDIQELFNTKSYHDYAFSWGEEEIVLCGFKSGCKKFAQFVKDHKTEIIIGIIIVAAIVVAVAVVTSSYATASAASAIAGGAGAMDSSSSSPTPNLNTTIDREIYAFKDTIAREEFLQPNFTPKYNNLSIEETGRALGSIFAHETARNLEQQASYHPQLFQEMHSMKSSCPSLSSYGSNPIDEKFSTNNAFLYANPKQEYDFVSLAYQAKGESALNSYCYQDAVYNLSKAIELEPQNSFAYLERGIAHFNLGNYEKSLEDYHTFTAESSKKPLVASEFAFGFIKGLPRGVGDGIKDCTDVACNSARGLAQAVRHPINTGKELLHTSQEIKAAFSALYDIGVSEGWNVVAGMTFSEVSELVQQWDTLDSEVRGEKSGYLFGKYGTDMLAFGGTVKVGLKTARGVRSFSTAYKNLQRAEKMLLLESAASLESTGGLAAVQSAQKSLVLSEELGFSLKELEHLRKAGQLESTLAKSSEFIANNPAMKESYELYNKAQAFLKPHGGFLPEARCRELIHQTGVKTFPRPKGIPENFKVKITDKGAGMEYVHPTNEHLRVRVMPGKAHSEFPHQQKPYVVQMKEGKALNKLGTKVNKSSAEAHQLLEEFIYREK